MYTWVPDMVQQSLHRASLIDQAIMDGKTQVHVPAFSDTVSNRKIMFISYVDDSKQYATEYYIKYYGIQIIVDK